jgi:hypothetical protein
MTDPQSERLKIKLGNAEFEAEGSPASVKERFEQFLALIEKQPAAAPHNTTITPDTGPLVTDSVPPTVQATAATLSGDGIVTVSEDVLSRVFRRDDDVVSLLALPKGDSPDADALIALLYAFQRLLNKSHVTGVTLMTAARQSGVSIPRIDTVLKSKADLVMAAGARRGRRYSLNNRGNVYAETLVRRMIE